MKKLQISKEISFPPDVVTQTLAAIGRKGAGKTYLATMIAEQILDMGAQVVAIDPVGNWWGLRVGSDGRSKGKEIFVMGGEHGDVPIVPEAGAKIAKLIVEKGISVILDISGFRLGERKRFCADFGEELLHMKKTQRTPVHIFIEEAQLIIPQRVGPEEARMVGAFEQIVRLGRNYGIGCTIVTQRPQSVNKEVLSQVECLCVLQVTGLHERKALEAWVQEAGADRSLVGELPSLSQGQGYVWSPSWLRIYKLVHFSKKQTFDASATPKVGRATRAASLSAVDVKKLKADMADVVAQAEKDDPIALRKQIAELQRKKPDEVEYKEVPVVSKSTLNRLESHEVMMADSLKSIKKFIQSFESFHNSLIDQLKLATGRTYSQTVFSNGNVVPSPDIKQFVSKMQIKRSEIRSKFAIPSGNITPVSQHSDFVLSSPQQKILNALGFLETRFSEPADKSQLAILADQTPTSSGYRNNLSGLRISGMIDYPTSGKVVLTDLGRHRADTSNIPRTNDEMHSMLFQKLSSPQIAMIKQLIEIYPDQTTKEELAARAEQTSTSSGYRNNLSRLRTLKLIDYPTSGMVVATKNLFI